MIKKHYINYVTFLATPLLMLTLFMGCSVLDGETRTAETTGQSIAVLKHTAAEVVKDANLALSGKIIDETQHKKIIEQVIDARKDIQLAEDLALGNITVTKCLETRTREDCNLVTLTSAIDTLLIGLLNDAKGGT